MECPIIDASQCKSQSTTDRQWKVYLPWEQTGSECSPISWSRTTELKSTVFFENELLQCPSAYRYIQELSWISNQRQRVVSRSRCSDYDCQSNGAHKSDTREKLQFCLPTASVFYRSTSRRRAKRHFKKSASEKLNAVILVPSSPTDLCASIDKHVQTAAIEDSNDKISHIDKGEGKLASVSQRRPTSEMSGDSRAILSVAVSDKFGALLPETFQQAITYGSLSKDLKFMLAATHRLQRSYGSLQTPSNKNLSIDYCDGADIKSSLLIDPMVPDHLASLMNYLRKCSNKQGSPSPVSPTPNEVSGQQPHGSQPTQPRRNKNQFCSLHGKDSEDVKESKGGGQGGWSWDKEEPLSLPGLCSCNDESLYKLWQAELSCHKSSCLTSMNPDTNPSDRFSNPDFNLVNWEEVKRGDFSSFLNDLGSGNSVEENRKFLKLRFCINCGGLPYISYSFIEISLNRDIPTLIDFVKKLPLPVPTEFFCDGLKVTGTLVARSPLHEWLILWCLRFAGLDRSARVFDVCARLLFPFHRLPDRGWPPATMTDPAVETSEALKPCLRHRLPHPSIPNKWVMTDPPRFVSSQQRRPYCLALRRNALPLAQPSSFPIEKLESLCWEWLTSQNEVQQCLLSIPSKEIAKDLKKTPVALGNGNLANRRYEGGQMNMP